MSSIFVGVHATTSPSQSEGCMESDVTRLMGNGVPDQTDRKRAMIRNIAAMNNMFPISDLTPSFMFHPIPIMNTCMDCVIYYFYGKKVYNLRYSMLAL